MGYDAGFDIYPPLGYNRDDKDNWQKLLRIVILFYRLDPILVRTETHLNFEVGEHPELNLDHTKFRRFSSKISGGRCGNAEAYLKEVFQLARKVFGPQRVHWWNDYFDEFLLPKYSWTEVYHPPALIINKFRRDVPNLPHLGFHLPDVLDWTIKAFEKVHVGMDGLRLSSAKFSVDGSDGYTIVQVSTGGLDPVNSIKDWTENVWFKPNRMAYWTTRLHNNCVTVNISLLKILQTYCQDRVDLLYVEIDSCLGPVPIKISSLTSRTVGLTPHTVGQIVEPPFVSCVPPSEDGETYHTFLVGHRQDTNEPVAIDASAAQYGVFPSVSWGGYDGDGCPCLVLPLVRFLRTIGKHRMLTSSEMKNLATYDNHPMIRSKVDECLAIALEAAWDGPDATEA